MQKVTFEKLVLYKIKKIIINEFNNPYYQNAGNISEVVDLGTEPIVSETNKYKYTDHVKNMFIYQNGFVKFNDFIRTLSAFPNVDDYTSHKVNLKSKNKLKRK